jgi:hypothetical protein
MAKPINKSCEDSLMLVGQEERCGAALVKRREMVQLLYSLHGAGTPCSSPLALFVATAPGQRQGQASFIFTGALILGGTSFNLKNEGTYDTQERE